MFRNFLAVLTALLQGHAPAGRPSLRLRRFPVPRLPASSAPDAKRVRNLRLLPCRFMVINRAMGMAKGKEAGAAYLAAWVEEMRATGFLARALQRHNIEGASVAPPGGAP